MPPRQNKTGYFILEGVNSFGTVFYLYYLYFQMKSAYGWGDAANLRLAALNGAIYMVGAWLGGKFAQQFGYFLSLKIGYSMMTVSLAAGCLASTAAGHVLVMAAVLIGMCFTWPTLEALVSEGEAPDSLQHQVGVYNVIWAGTGAVAYFVGGAIMESLGTRSMYYLPAAIMVVQLVYTLWLEKTVPLSHPMGEGSGVRAISAYGREEPHIPAMNPRPIARARRFLRMAWLANPFAYVALQTVLAVVPGVAKRLELSTMVAGFSCSLWCFARLGGFAVLWLWSGWHYRFGWLIGSFAVLIASFVGILIAPNLQVLLGAQILFGGALALLYYSSLFYAMDVGDTKGEHGGIHEAIIGLGNCAGPGVGALSLYFWPENPQSGVIAVAAVLAAGFAALLGVWRAGK
jgi:MFS family permease